MFNYKFHAIFLFIPLTKQLNIKTIFVHSCVQIGLTCKRIHLYNNSCKSMHYRFNTTEVINMEYIPIILNWFRRISYKTSFLCWFVSNARLRFT